MCCEYKNYDITILKPMKKAPLHLKFNDLLDSLLSSSSSPSTAIFNQVLSQSITSGLSLHTYPLSRLLLLYSSSLLSTTTRTNSSGTKISPFSLLSLSPHPPSTFLFNTLISSLSLSHTPLSLSLYSRLLAAHPHAHPNPHTYPSLLKACASTPRWAPLALSLHAHILTLGLAATTDPFLLSALIALHSHTLPLARHLFDQIPHPDTPIWNCLLLAYLKSSQANDESLSLFRRMLLLRSAKPNEVTLVAVTSACGNSGALAQGMWAHAYLLRNGGVVSVNRYVATALIEMYSKCGRLDLARQVFDGLSVLSSERDTMCFNAMIRALAIHGCGRAAVGLFRRMQAEGSVLIDDVTMVAVISACAHAGLVCEGRELFDRMRSDFGVEPKEEHYGCLIDLLGRAGMLCEAQKVVMEMPFKPNASMYRSLLGACRLHEKNLELGESLIARLMQLDPDHGGNYVMQSNLYANVSRWDKVGRVRKLMKDKGISKTPGLSLVEMDGVVHEFSLGDKTHPQSDRIYAMLDEVGRRLHEHGHKPRTKEVLFDVEDEDKEDALSYHSERLAIAFSLVASDSGAPIRIIKNLRVCWDCHASTKLVSLIYRREIIVRDRTRFHHFKDGACSCLDYW